ncbi:MULTISPECIES: hypothetical protein [Lysobacter]|jgi:hypothetical protein|uniref:RES domain-containing protein n=1 Tax=Lysobacter gummosus TaxID=262324 RepID=A0ABY3XJP8_9GAMM|nr:MULTISPECIES: hypothetical protein [Lysobacter]UJB21475.1 hypothetical protein L1A79_10665 [Lysobacter capsici]UJQ29408.1 hypothetical protein L2D09_04200 [Lysobacter gummosus]UNP31875.1 hypothetical protein MOV92_11740 [Lysobacter gummosus]
MPVKLIQNVLGDERKRELLAQYELEPLIHARLLNGARLMCCCGKPLGTDYYRFDAFNRSTAEQEGIVYAGSTGNTGCAARLMTLAADRGEHIGKLPLFDPLELPAAFRVRSEARGRARDPMAHWDPFNRELFNAIHLTLIAWNTSPGRVLARLLRELRLTPERRLHDWKAESFNTVLGFGPRTLTQMIASLRQSNPTLQRFEFPELQAALRHVTPNHL